MGIHKIAVALWGNSRREFEPDEVVCAVKTLVKQRGGVGTSKTLTI